MNPRDRLLKKRREAEHLRTVPAEVTLEMGFAMTAFAREVAEAATHARA